jgi:hypothetical protein
VSAGEYRALGRRAVEDARAMLEGGGAPSLEADELRGLCGSGSAAVAKRLEDFGIPSEDIATHQAGVLFDAPDERHAFTTYRAGDSAFLADATSRQFFGPGAEEAGVGHIGESLLGMGEPGTRLARELTSRGVVELTPETAAMHGEAFGAHSPVSPETYFDPANLAEAKERYSERFGVTSGVIDEVFAGAPSPASTQAHVGNLPRSMRPGGAHADYRFTVGPDGELVVPDDFWSPSRTPLLDDSGVPILDANGAPVYAPAPTGRRARRG